MTITEAAVSGGTTVPRDPARRPAPEWRVAAALARREAVRLVRASLVPLALAVMMNLPTTRGDITDLRSASYNTAFTFLLLAAVVLVVSHRAVTRSRRHGSDEMLTATPAPPRARTAGHLLAVLAPTALAALVAAWLGWDLTTRGTTVGDVVPVELAVGPLLVAGAGCLGVLLARVWPQAFTPYVACVVIAAFELGVNTPRLGGSGARWLAFWVEGSLWWALPRHSTTHLVYLLGLVAMAAVGALLRHGLTRRLVALAVAAVVVTAGAAAAQMRQPQPVWRRANAMFADPSSVQTCTERDGVRYCAFDITIDLVDHFEEMVGGVRAVVPAPAWPDDLAVTQRVTALDFEHVGDSPRWLPHLPDMPRQRIRQPDDGEIHPAVDFGWSSGQETGFGVEVAAAAVGLPIVPDPADGSVCLAAGQARGVVALWAGAHATDDAGDGLERIVARAEAAVASQGDHEADAVLPIAEVDVYGGFAVSLADARLALRLLDADDAAARITERWDVLTDPATPSSQLADVLGVDDVGAVTPPREPSMAHVDPDVATLRGPCR